MCFLEDGTFEFIQVKYYPKTEPKMKVISTDLYYQYLRHQMLQSTMKAKPSLYIHRMSEVEKPTLDEMKTYIGLGGALPESVTYSNAEDLATWLRENVYSTKGKNIVNVLSNGQINVFMLAHFFAGINARNDHEKMKVYFIDDLTACMDDVNMLAFMDLLKYQMSSKATMEQLFFITCDERISKLLKYKLSGRGIELCELLETDFASRNYV